MWIDLWFTIYDNSVEKDWIEYGINEDTYHLVLSTAVDKIIERSDWKYEFNWKNVTDKEHWMHIDIDVEWIWYLLLHLN